ncbi:MAG: branched-chain amino acid transport system II carrier protein [Clostridiales Family XIII bacterium]|jgi:LIVCS family branched-chain amino acid:cation transporter|nr:branched-chain amino acid transport system II carrier protein [Clostridiales Family XIII bacterium]
MAETTLNSSQKRGSGKSVIVIVGFMIFAQFFGAGNLIFPPFLGFVGGGKWIVGFIFFFIFDVILGVMGLAASGKFPQVEIGAYYRPGRKFMLIMGGIGVFITSAFVVPPRAALTSYEVFLKPVMAGGFENVETTTGLQLPAVVFLLLYFGLALLCAIRPSKVVDIMGKFLTPALLVILIVVIIVGLANMGSSGVRPEAYPTSSPSLIAFGVAQGLQTFDGPTGTLIAIIIIVSLLGKGINKTGEQTKMIIKSGFVAAICLGVIYLGLGLLGAFYSNDPTLTALFAENGGLDQTWLLNYILSRTLGLGGTVIFGLAILLATFSTALGCIGLASEFFSRISERKISYKTAVCAFAIIGFVVGVILSTTPSGVQTLLNLTLPFLLISMPVTVVLIILNLFSEKIRNDNVFRGAAIAAGIWGLASGIAYLTAFTIGGGAPEALAVYGSGWYAGFFFGQWNFIYTLTGDLGYILPAVIGAVIGALIKKGGYAERPYLREHAGDDSFDFAALKAKKSSTGAA